MPTALRPPKPRARRRSPEIDPVVDPVAVAEFAAGGAHDASTDNRPVVFDPFVVENDGGLPFMDAIAMITDAEWQSFWLYLYRLDPQVRNAETDNKFIARYQVMMTEDEIQREHGGGKYIFYLKEIVPRETVQERGYRARERRFKFSIDGAAKFQRGQTLVSQGSSSAAPEGTVLPPTTGDSEGAALAKSLPELLRIAGANNGKNNGMEQVVEMLTAASKASMTIITENTRQQLTSTTGSAIGDKLLEMMLTRDAKPPAHSKVEEQLIQIALEKLSNPQPAAAAGGLGQLGELKELFGVDSIFDLIKGGIGGGNDSWKGKLVDMAGAFIANAPALFQLFIQNQQLQLQREVAMRNQPTLPGQPGAVQPPVGPVVMNPPAAAGPIPVAPVQPQMPPGAMTVDPVAMALGDIVACFDSNLSGDAAASLIQTKYPQFVTMFVPLLENRQQVELFAKNTPPLSDIAGEDGFPEFLDQFIQEMLHPAGEEPHGDQAS